MEAIVLFTRAIFQNRSVGHGLATVNRGTVTLQRRSQMCRHLHASFKIVKQSCLEQLLAQANLELVLHSLCFALENGDAVLIISILGEQLLLQLCIGRSIHFVPCIQCFQYSKLAISLH